MLSLMKPISADVFLMDVDMAAMTTVTVENIKEIKNKYNMALGSTKVSFLDKAINILNDFECITQGGIPLFSLVPLNLIFWLYDIGNDGIKRRKTYKAMGKHAAKLIRMKNVNNNLNVSVDNIPVLPRVVETIRNWDVKLNKVGNMNFVFMQAILGFFLFAVRGKSKSEGILTDEMIDEAFPLLKLQLPNVFSNKEMYAYTALYRETDTLWNTTLFKAAATQDIIACIMFLLERGQKTIAYRGSKTSLVSISDILVKILTYINISTTNSIEESQKFIYLGGNKLIW